MNQGDALEHNFSAIHSALMFPITHLLSGSGLPQVSNHLHFSRILGFIVGCSHRPLYCDFCNRWLRRPCWALGLDYTRLLLAAQLSWPQQKRMCAVKSCVPGYLLHWMVKPWRYTGNVEHDQGFFFFFCSPNYICVKLMACSFPLSRVCPLLTQ